MLVNQLFGGDQVSVSNRLCDTSILRGVGEQGKRLQIELRSIPLFTDADLKRAFNPEQSLSFQVEAEYTGLVKPALAVGERGLA